MPTWLDSVLSALGVAIGGGMLSLLWKISSDMGFLRATVTDHDRRIDGLERHTYDRRRTTRQRNDNAAS